MKKLLITTWTMLVVSGLLLLVGWWSSARLGEPSASGKQAEVARFEAMPSHLDWKPTALSLIKSRQEFLHSGSVVLGVVQVASVAVVGLSVLNLLFLRKVTRRENCAA